MLSAVFLINQKGEIIIYRLYRCAAGAVSLASWGLALSPPRVPEPETPLRLAARRGGATRATRPLPAAAPSKMFLDERIIAAVAQIAVALLLLRSSLRVSFVCDSG
jgi:hypothetical protein